MKQIRKNENILCAIIALMKELDSDGLEFVRLDATKQINKLSQNSNSPTKPNCDPNSFHLMSPSKKKGHSPPVEVSGKAKRRLTLQKKRGMWNRADQQYGPESTDSDEEEEEFEQESDQQDSSESDRSRSKESQSRS